jgi:hypothetical protein
LPNRGAAEMADAPARPRARLLVFVHVPKTGGTTLRTVMSMNEPGPRSRALGNVFKGGGGISKGLIERLRKDQGPDLRGVGLIRGHFPLGIREYLPRYMQKDRELRCFTFLRQPAERTLSHYFRILEYGRGYGLPPLPENATLEDMLEGGYLHDNVQTRMLSGLAEPFGEVDDEMLEQAKRNLREELAFFGLTERFDESLVLAKRRLGFRTILYRSSGRVNKERPRGEDVPSDLREAAEACNRYDIELYRYGQRLFDKAPERNELDFEVELAALHAAKANGALDPQAPVPAGFDGGEDEWRMLLDARAELLRMEFELARNPRIKAARSAAAPRDRAPVPRAPVPEAEAPPAARGARKSGRPPRRSSTSRSRTKRSTTSKSSKPRNAAAQKRPAAVAPQRKKRRRASTGGNDG